MSHIFCVCVVAHLIFLAVAHLTGENVYLKEKRKRKNDKKKKKKREKEKKRKKRKRRKSKKDLTPTEAEFT